MTDSDTKSGFFSDDPGLRLFVSNIAQERKLFALAVLFACLGAVFEGVGLGLLVPFLKGLMEPNAAPLATGVEVIDHYVLAVDSTPLHRLYQVCGLILFSIGLRVTFGYFSTYRERPNAGEHQPPAAVWHRRSASGCCAELLLQEAVRRVP